MKKNQGFAPVLILVAVLVVLAIGGIAYFAGKSSTPAPQNVPENNSQLPENQNSVSNIPVQNTVTNNTANQQTQNSNPLPPTTCTPSITVLSPNGGEVFSLGQTINIKWSSKCINSNALVYLNIGIKDSQAVSELLSLLKVANTGSYNFIIPSNYNLSGHNSNKYDLAIDYIYGNGEGVGDRSDAPFIINPSETTQIKVYFSTPNSEQLMCNDVTAVDRIISKTASVGKATLEELLKGPTAEEKNKGYFTDIPVGSKLNSLVIVNGEARANFNDITESGGGSCSMALRATQIRQTLLQFPTIKTVTISVDGRTEDIFQP